MPKFETLQLLLMERFVILMSGFHGYTPLVVPVQ